MTKIATDKERNIIDDFAEEIKKRATKTATPKKTVIDFRNETKDCNERDVYVVPIELLRFRKDNGRIASDVLSYEKNYGPLSETRKEDQEIIEKFLYDKDRDKTDELMKSLIHSGQREPAIITCDGFLINGNRRKMAFEKLFQANPGNENFKSMRVVILPGKGEAGGPPTLKEIELIENRYQLQSDGKAEYYNFDRALSMRHKMQLGISLEEQLRDDPNFAALPGKEFKKATKKISDEYLGPLECVDKYLDYLGRQGLYNTVSEGREGRWQAFIDYYQSVHKKIYDDKQRIKMRVKEDEIGKIENAAFKIIRKKDLPDLGKVHAIMRDFPRILSEPGAKEEILKIAEIDDNIPSKERYDKDGNELELRDQDKIWCGINGQEIIKRLKKAKGTTDYINETETPLELLEAAIKKLNHNKMDLSAIQLVDINKAMDLIRNLRERIRVLEGEAYHISKNYKKMMSKKEK
jgi:hypothetical protein